MLRSVEPPVVVPVVWACALGRSFAVYLVPVLLLLKCLLPSIHLNSSWSCPSPAVLLQLFEDRAKDELESSDEEDPMSMTLVPPLLDEEPE